MSDALKDAAFNTLCRLAQNRSVNGRQNPYGEGWPNAVWMLCGIRDGYIKGLKAHRWLGYAQGVLVQAGEISLQGCEDVNRTAFKENENG